MAVLSRSDPQALLVASIGPACHELRSPLAVVYGFAKMLDAQATLDDTARKYVSQIVNGAQQLDDLLDALGKVARIASGRLTPSLDSIALREVVDALVTTSRNAERVTVDAGADVQVRADTDWLGEAFQGIIDALCFEDETDLRLTWTHEGHEVSVHFHPHSAFPMVDTEPGKSSLGLTLARIGVVGMGGALEGNGDRVTVLLPRG